MRSNFILCCRPLSRAILTDNTCPLVQLISYVCWWILKPDRAQYHFLDFFFSYFTDFYIVYVLFNFFCDEWQSMNLVERGRKKAKKDRISVVIFITLLIFTCNKRSSLSTLLINLFLQVFSWFYFELQEQP